MKYLLLFLFLLAGCRNSIDDMNATLQLKNMCENKHGGVFYLDEKMGLKGATRIISICKIGNLTFELNPADLRK